MGYSSWYFVENGSKMIFDLNIPTERPSFELSKNQKINEIESSELKLWPFKVTDMCTLNWFVCALTGKPSGYDRVRNAEIGNKVGPHFN